MKNKYTRDELKEVGIHDLRNVLRNEFGGKPGTANKETLIETILDLQERGDRPEGASKRGPGRPPLQTYGEVTGLNSTFHKENVLTFRSKSAGDKELEERKVEGVLELNPNESYGFIRTVNYDNSSEDVFVAPALIKSNNLRNGDYVAGKSRSVDSKADALTKVITVNDIDVSRSPMTVRADFDTLVPHFPIERYTLERGSETNDLSLRCIDLFAPIGKGQRGLIVAPPKAGKTTLLKKIANALDTAYPEAKLITLLIDERPEEVTDMRENIGGDVVSSTFDQSPEHHIKIAELVLDRAKREVETGKHVIILLDSITRLARAYNAVAPSSGKTLSGGMEIGALQFPKKFFGTARNVVGVGSLTIIATVLVDTGSKMDEVIYEEFKGTGNMELHLSRELSERRIFPAIDIYKSGTRKDDLLLTAPEISCANQVRKMFENDKNACENLLEMMSKTENNAEFIRLMPEWVKLASRR